MFVAHGLRRELDHALSFASHKYRISDAFTDFLRYHLTHRSPKRRVCGVEMAIVLIVDAQTDQVNDLTQTLLTAGYPASKAYADPLDAMDALCALLAQEDSMSGVRTDAESMAESGAGTAAATPGDRPDGAWAREVAQAMSGQWQGTEAAREAVETLASVQEVVAAVATIKNFSQELLLQRVRRWAGVETDPAMPGWPSTDLGAPSAFLADVQTRVH